MWNWEKWPTLLRCKWCTSSSSCSSSTIAFYNRKWMHLCMCNVFFLFSSQFGRLAMTTQIWYIYLNYFKATISWIYKGEGKRASSKAHKSSSLHLFKLLHRESWYTQKKAALFYINELLQLNSASLIVWNESILSTAAESKNTFLLRHITRCLLLNGGKGVSSQLICQSCF